MNIFARKTVPFSRNVATRVTKSRGLSSQPFGGLPTQLYQGVWRKSNIMYITYVVVGCVAIEVIYGGVTTRIWESANQGKLYHQIDWSQFKSEDDDDEDEDEDE